MIACVITILALSGPVKAERYRWKNVDIVAGGFVSGLLYHPRQNGLAYARTDIGGAYRWDSRLGKWVPLLDWLTKPDWNLYGIESMAIDPNNPRWLYLACGTYTNKWGGPGAILSSDNQGRSFKRCDLPFKLGGNEDGRSMGERLAVDPNDGRRLYFGTRSNGLWVSEDRGRHWAQVKSFPIKGHTNGFGVTCVVFDARKKLQNGHTASIYVGVASHSENLYHSSDGGVTWEAMDQAPSGFFVHHLAINTSGKLFATYTDSSGPNGITDGAVYRLDIDANTWTDITPVKPDKLHEKGFGYAGLSVDPIDGSTLVVSTLDRWNPGDDVFYSTDSGASWTGLAKSSVRDASAAPYMTWGAKVPRFGWWIGAVAVDPFKKTRVLYGTGANIWGCDDVLPNNVGLPTHWTIRGMGIEETADIDLLSPPSGPPLITALGDIGGFTHQDLDQPAPGMSLNPLLGNTDCLACSSAYHVVVKVGRPNEGQMPGGVSHDDGRTWAAFPSKPTRRSVGGSVAVSSDGRTIVWSPNGTAPFWTNDDGKTWAKSVGTDGPLQLVADPKKVSNFLGISADGQLFRSEDDGRSFAKLPVAPMGTDHGVLRAFPDSSETLFLPTSKGLFRWSEEGLSFQKMEGIDSADSIGFGRARPGSSHSTLFLNGQVSGQFGVFRSDDLGLTWTRITDPNHEYATRGVVIGDPRIYGRVYLGTNGRGVLYGDPNPIHGSE